MLGAEGGSFDDALRRSIAYVKEGGADLVWLNSVETREDVKRACAEIPAPVLVIWGGNDAPPSTDEYEALGARIVLYPVDRRDGRPASRVGGAQRSAREGHGGDQRMERARQPEPLGPARPRACSSAPRRCA